MVCRSRALATAAGLALLAGLAPAAAADSFGVYYYDDPPVYDEAPVTYYYYAPAPRTYVYRERIYVAPRRTSYYYRPVAPYYGPYYGYGYYGNETVGGYYNYRITPDR